MLFHRFVDFLIRCYAAWMNLPAVIARYEEDRHREAVEAHNRIKANESPEY